MHSWKQAEFPFPRQLTSWDQKWLGLAHYVAEKFGKDPSTKVGCVIQGPTPNKVAFGWNGLPPDIEDDHRLLDREWKYDHVVHAEMNALANCTFEPKVLYVTQPPCHRCAVHILTHRSVERIVASVSEEFLSRWADSVKKTEAVFRESGRVRFQIIQGEGGR